MNKKLEMGMYIRTKNHGIKKILGIGSYCGINQYILDEEGNYTIGNGIIKSSHNLIDLIEVGDYVNGCYVSNLRASCNEYLGGNSKQIGIIEIKSLLKKGNYNDSDFKWLSNKDIKSIVTKEQFKSLEYEVK